MLIRVASCVVALAAMFSTGLRLNASPSMPLGVYWFTQGAFPTQRGQVVFACPSGAAIEYVRRWEANESEGGTCPDGSKPFVKYAAALPGDVVTIERDGIHVNGGGALRGSVALHDVVAEHGRHSIVHLSKNRYVVAKGTVWLYSPQWFSFDSRYFGAQPIVGLAKPLLIRSLPIQEHGP